MKCLFNSFSACTAYQGYICRAAGSLQSLLVLRFFVEPFLVSPLKVESHDCSASNEGMEACIDEPELVLWVFLAHMNIPTKKIPRNYREKYQPCEEPSDIFQLTKQWW